MDTEGHPIPQDITGFQFRLIGDMTVKQFAYLAGGAVSAWLFFSTPLAGIIKIPLAAGCGLLGVILAFMPIHGRPADLMLMLFFKALFKANQFTYKTDATQIGLHRAASESNTPAPATPLIQTNPNPTVTVSNTDPAPIQPPPVNINSKNPEQSAQPSPPTQSPNPPPAPPPIQPNPLPESSSEQTLEGEGNLPISKTPVIPPDALNLISGVVEDPRGNVLQNILVEITDTADSPVRAFKTNRMGQFIAATPLENGTYKITLEDPDKRHQFPTLTFIAKGEPLQPLEIKSMDQREQLRQSLFTTTVIPPIQ